MVTGTTGGGDGSAVLEDPTGRRARWLRRAGRGVFLLFLAWLLAIVLGGLGLIPVAPIPLGHALRPTQGPPALTKLPPPQQPSASDLRPAVPAKVFAAKVRKKAAPTAIAAPGHSATAPGQTKTVTNGKSATAPGQTKTVTNGKKGTAPGQNKTTTTTTSTVRSKGRKP